MQIEKLVLMQEKIHIDARTQEAKQDEGSFKTIWDAVKMLYLRQLKPGNRGWSKICLGYID